MGSFIITFLFPYESFGIHLIAVQFLWRGRVGQIVWICFSMQIGRLIVLFLAWTPHA